ncbi:uracil phosphoribosyltransferase [Calderihabitans maritimus]|uniref:Uracil phosphoribosyltransferase n=1 Tax=Calderihabitans maritimus TaxID=1246530 RepID=A0A1Z5HWY7_9FIRM|nr:uracil phosphoribosyltransferase [Calderihabitans maritimus]GAW93825.1 uracil phosphoribosyltransferase [Calderihabitans maritimus]
MSELHLLDHPLIQHKLSLMRDKNISCKKFRELLEEVAMLMAYEVTRNLPLEETKVQTPIAEARVKVLAARMSIIAILRAGLGMVNGMLRLIPTARVGHIGLYRDPHTLEPVQYYYKLPKDVADGELIVVDPMLATGGSAAGAIQLLKEKGARDITLLSLIAAPEGIQRVRREHPEVDIYTAAVDERLNDHGYIVPGLGDAGDRLFGTE